MPKVTIMISKVLITKLGSIKHFPRVYASVIQCLQLKLQLLNT